MFRSLAIGLALLGALATSASAQTVSADGPYGGKCKGAWQAFQSKYSKYQGAIAALKRVHNYMWHKPGNLGSCKYSFNNLAKHLYEVDAPANGGTSIDAMEKYLRCGSPGKPPHPKNGNVYGWYQGQLQSQFGPME